MYPARPFKNNLTRETFFDRFFVYKHLAVKGLSMKKLFYVLPGLCLFASGAAAETIDSVSFNPARLGRYETLKVSDQLTTKGGIEANAVTVQSGGTVSVNNAGNYKFPATEVKGSVEMTSTDFKADTLNSRGTASFENKSSSAESKISTLNTSTADVRANILDLTSVTVPTGGSLTLGENAIPEPTQSCSNLRWVERTTDDNYKYKVLAFGACAGEDDDCKESYGSWITFTGSKTDTCNGRTNAQYLCSGTAKSCVDVYITSSGSSGNKYGTPTSAASSATDTCDGNTADKYTCGSQKAQCTDVYSEVSGTIDSAYYLPNTTRCFSSCSAGYWDQNYSAKDIIENQGIDAFCADVMADNPHATQCAGCVKWKESSYGGTHRAYTCTAQRYSRSVSCGGQSSTSQKYRNVTCCDGGGLVSSGQVGQVGTIVGTLKP